ncbi:hypothetical protein [Gordonia sp. FQ]|uniref:hypothetical protein n=1 Tax=Gordonia sp. FQ TaxID=3446634 RepID=UPI003F84451A
MVAAPAPQANAKSVAGIEVPSPSSLNPATMLGKVVGGLVNNSAAQDVAAQWRTEVCASGGTSKQGMADCSQSTGTGVAMVIPGSIGQAPSSGVTRC